MWFGQNRFKCKLIWNRFKW